MLITKYDKEQDKIIKDLKLQIGYLKSLGGGGGGGSTNLFIQQTAPVAVGNYMWVELNPDTTVKTIWINS